MTLTKRILDTLVDHPDWSSVQVGEAVGCRPEYVRAIASRHRPKEPSVLVKLTRAQLAEDNKRYVALAQRDLTAQLMGDPPVRA